MYDLTQDARFVGYVGAAIALPAIVLNLVGGAIVDKVNPARLMVATQSIMALVVIALGILVAVGLANAWHVLTASVLIGAVQAFDAPNEGSIYPRLMERRAVPSAVALISVVWTGTRVVAPSIAGMIIAWANIESAIFLSAVGFLSLAMVSLRLKLNAVPSTSSGMLQQLISGIVYVKNSPVFSFLIGMTFFNSLFGMSFLYLMPVIAHDALGVGAEKIGWLMGASGAGSLTGVSIMSFLVKKRPAGLLIITGATLFGIFLLVFALTTYNGLYVQSMLAACFGSLCNSAYLLAVLTTLQTLVPDSMRGRVMGIYAITWSVMPLGGLQANLVAHYINAPVAIALGGGMIIALALCVALFNPTIRQIGRPA